jgi:hypothetical protein
MQCPACARIFNPQQLPFRLPSGWEVDRGEAGKEEMAEGPGWTFSSPPDLDFQYEEEGGWRGLETNLRRDCEPHRAMWIVLLGNSSLVLASMAMLLFGVPGLVGLPLGIIAWSMGNHDLEHMRRGLMDPQGFINTRRGRESGILGAFLSATFLAGYGLLFLAMLKA